MNRCPECDVMTVHRRCPLCQTELSEAQAAIRWYPDYDRKQQRIRARISRLAIFIGILAVLVCFFINLIVLPQFLWVFYVAVAVFYALVSLSHTILSASHIGGKITAQVISLTIVLLVIDAMSGAVQWSVDYVVPALIIAGILVITIIMVTVRLKWTGYVSFLLMMIGLGFVPAVLYLTGLATVLWPSLVAALYAVATFALMLVFANQAFMTQLGRRFHL
ncbi:DUF6320 domain-containing protein [Salinicoccus roseus]|uniref:DUF6320 domain-containing protein n=1 Tax=Salinicoccus roseus TaxID=45670 RepID=UPI000F511083|nr:DUF6320 domain-containing protein [Salinicoccus roseus]RPE51790.1 hypothetical protein EDC33_2002 [Salinicoccus roseus]